MLLSFGLVAYSCWRLKRHAKLVPEKVQQPSSKMDPVDEASMQSFPASDPPGRY